MRPNAQVIAQIIKRARREWGHDREYLDAIHDTLPAITDRLATEDAAFDREEFLRMCGIEEQGQ